METIKKFAVPALITIGLIALYNLAKAGNWLGFGGKLP